MQDQTFENNFELRFVELSKKVDELIALTNSTQPLPQAIEAVNQNPFWHYQCAFDALSTMSKFAAPALFPTTGFLTNYLGVKIDTNFFPGLLDGRDNSIDPIPAPNNWHADIAEFAAALRAVDLAKETFTVLELGCGWGCWLNNTGAAARRAGKKVKLIGIEGDEGHFRFANQSMATNAYNTSEFEILLGVASANAGTALFPIQETAGIAWGLEPTFNASIEEVKSALKKKSHSVLRMIPLSEVVEKNGNLDLLHIDIQGGEADLIEQSISTCNSNVAYIVIGTHSRAIEGRLETIFRANGWVLEVDRPAIISLENGTPTLRVDGVHGWRNSRLLGN